jgi:hypothetical protein
VRATNLRWMRYGALVFGEMVFNQSGRLSFVLVLYCYWSFCEYDTSFSSNTPGIFRRAMPFCNEEMGTMNAISESQRNTMLMHAVNKRIRHLRLLKWYMVAYYSCFRILLGGVSGGALPRKDCARASSAPGRGMLEV